MSVAINSSPAGSINKGGFSKRSRAPSDDEAERQGELIKRAKVWKLVWPTPAPIDEDKESIYTVQGYETEYARDTSDTSTHTWLSDSDSEDNVAIHVGVEYELDSGSENEIATTSMSSFSEPENIFEVEFITFYDSEGMIADGSDVSMCSKESEVRRSAFRKCVQCGSSNNSMYQYCQICYQKRKSCYPRPRPRRKTKSSNELRKSDSTATTITVNSAVSNSQELCEMDSGLGSSQVYSTSASSQEMDGGSLKRSDDATLSFNSSATIEPRSSILSASQNSDSPIPDSQGSEMIFESQSSEASATTTTTNISGNRDEVDSRPSSSQESLESLENEVDQQVVSNRLEAIKKEGNTYVTLALQCIICCKNSRDTIFIHGLSSHLLCCFTCARKVCKYNSNRCPMCNRKILKLSKVFVS